VNREAVLARAGGDRELLQELIEIFRGDYPRHLAEIKAAVAAGDAARLNRSAHALKGAASMFGADGVCAAARTLESMGQSGSLAGAAQTCAALEEALRQFEPALASLLS
jgi:HPt (histidine-containing phosphotransfer) domain-containing protein